MPTTRVASVAIDARTLPAANRSARILDAFDKLPVGGSLELNEESDPRSLRNEFQQYRAGRFSWDARNLGSGRWTIRLERIDERADTATFLSHCAPFASAKQTTINELAQVATERAYRTGETVFDEGEMWPYLGFVRGGKVVYTLLSPDGKTHALGERLTHDPLNESGTFDGGGATTRAEALTDCSVVLIPSESLLHAVRNDSELALGFLAEASQARRRSIDTIADLAFAHVLQRVAKFLMSYAPSHDRHGARPARRGEPLAGPDRRRRRHGARHGRSRADQAQERAGRDARPRAGAGDRPRAARGLRSRSPSAARLGRCRCEGGDSAFLRRKKPRCVARSSFLSRPRSRSRRRCPRSPSSPTRPHRAAR